MSNCFYTRKRMPFFVYIFGNIKFFFTILGPPVIVGMSINIASIDSISEVNMVSFAVSLCVCPSHPKMCVVYPHTAVFVIANFTYYLWRTAHKDPVTVLGSTVG